MASVAALPKGPPPVATTKQKLGGDLLESLKAFAGMSGIMPGLPAPPRVQEAHDTVVAIPDTTVCPYCQGEAAQADDQEVGQFECSNCGRRFSMDADGASQGDPTAPSISLTDEPHAAAPTLRVPRVGGVYSGDVRVPQAEYESVPKGLVEWFESRYEGMAAPAEDQGPDGGSEQPTTDDWGDEDGVTFDGGDVGSQATLRGEPIEDLTKNEAGKTKTTKKKVSPPSGAKKQIDHYLYVPHHKVNAAVAALNSHGMRSNIVRGKGESHTQIVAHHSASTSEHDASKDAVRKIAKKVGGTYDGWGTSERVRESFEGMIGEGTDTILPAVGIPRAGVPLTTRPKSEAFAARVQGQISEFAWGKKVGVGLGAVLAGTAGVLGSGAASGYLGGRIAAHRELKAARDAVKDEPLTMDFDDSGPYRMHYPRHEAVSIKESHKLKWSTSAAGKGSSYRAHSKYGEYHIWSPQHRTPGGHHLYFANTSGKVKQPGLWRDLGHHETPEAAMQVAAIHARSVRKAQSAPKHENLTTANVGTGPDRSLGSSTMDTKIEVRKDPDKTFSIVAAYEGGTFAVLESGIQTEDEAKELLADYQEQYGTGEAYKTEQKMTVPTTKNLIESIARSGSLDEKALRLFLEDEDFGKILPTPNAGPAYDIDPAEDLEDGESEPYLQGGGMEPQDGGGYPQDNALGTLPEQDPPTDSGPTRDPFTGDVEAAADGSPEDAQFTERVRRHYAPRIRERIDRLFEDDDKDDDDKPAFLKKKDKDDDKDDDDDDDKKGKDDDEDDDDKKESLSRFQVAMNEAISLIPVSLRESMSRKHYNHIAHILNTSKTQGEVHHRLADMMAMDNPRFDKERFHKAAGTAGYETPARKPKKESTNSINLNHPSGLRAQMVLDSLVQKAAPSMVHEAMSTQFGRALRSFEEALDPIQPATPADFSSTNPGATPDEDVAPDATPEMANNANPPMKEAAARRRRSTQEGRFLSARYGRSLHEEGDPLTGEPTVDTENDNPNGEETPSDPGSFYTASPEASAANQEAQDMNAPTSEVASLQSLDSGGHDPDQVSFNIPATQESIEEAAELIENGMINYMPESYQRFARKLVKQGLIEWDMDTVRKVGTAAANVAKTGVHLGGMVAQRGVKAANQAFNAHPVAAMAAGAAVGSAAAGLAKRAVDRNRGYDESIAEGSFEDFIAPLADKDDEHLIRRNVESRRSPVKKKKVVESDYDRQLQVGTRIYAKGVEGVGNGTQGEVSFQMPTSEGYLYLVQFSDVPDGKLVRQDQLTV